MDGYNFIFGDLHGLLLPDYEISMRIHESIAAAPYAIIPYKQGLPAYARGNRIKISEALEVIACVIVHLFMTSS